MKRPAPQASANPAAAFKSGEVARLLDGAKTLTRSVASEDWTLLMHSTFCASRASIGTPSAEHVDDEARQKAKEQLDRIAARKVKKAAKMQHKRRVGLAADFSGERVEAVRNAQAPAQDAP